MTTVSTHPKELNDFFPTENAFSDFALYQKQEDEFVKQVQKYCKKNGSGKYAGEVLRTPMGDGYAQYVVFSLRPVVVIHLEIGDAWDSRDVRHYTPALIKEKIEGEKTMAKLFSNL